MGAERDIQKRLISKLRSNGVRVLSVPNDIHMDGDLKQRQIHMAEMKRAGLAPGSADVLILDRPLTPGNNLPGQTEYFHRFFLGDRWDCPFTALELKTARQPGWTFTTWQRRLTASAMSKEQQRWAADYVDLGAAWGLCFGWDEVEAFCGVLGYFHPSFKRQMLARRKQWALDRMRSK